MGLDYCLWCKNCADSSMKTEFSACHDISMKHPDEAEQVVEDWTEFMTRHQGHNISLIDAFGKETNPRDLTGKYILGIDKLV